jgi:hypothetical protein
MTMTEPMTTTLNRIRAHGPCQDGWAKLLRHLGKTGPDDEPLPFSVIVESNGLDDALYCLRAEPRYERKVRLYAVWCARRVEYLNTDPRVKAANDVSKRYANGRATAEELDVAAAAAWAAEAEAEAGAAQRSVAWAAAAARAAAEAGEAWAAVGAAATAAQRSVAWAAVGAAEAAAAMEAEREAQTTEFLRIANGGDYPS